MKISGTGSPSNERTRSRSTTLKGCVIPVTYEIEIHQQGGLPEISGRVHPLTGSTRRMFIEAGVQRLTLEMADKSTLPFVLHNNTGAILGSGPIVPPPSS